MTSSKTQTIIDRSEVVANHPKGDGCTLSHTAQLRVAKERLLKQPERFAVSFWVVSGFRG